MFLACNEGSVRCEPGAALQPQPRLYEPTDTVVQEHVVLIGSRARPRPVKAPAHNDRQSAAATRTTWQIKTQNAPVLVPGFSHVLSCGSPAPKLINNDSCIHSAFPQNALLTPRYAGRCDEELMHKEVFHICLTVLFIKTPPHLFARSDTWSFLLFTQ